MSSYSEYTAFLRKDNLQAADEFISAMTTNTTQFFRENEHFLVLKNLLPKVLSHKEKTKNRELRIWCAASSTGQEPYSIAMTVLESISNSSNWAIKILATDIDLNVLDTAARAVYTSSEVNGIPQLILQKYLDSQIYKGEKYYRVKKDVRSLITFAPFNLLNETYDFKFPFDFIFCRNVLIYFNRPTAALVIDKLSKKLHKNGYLFLGHSEAGMVKSQTLKSESHAVYSYMHDTLSGRET